MCDGAGERTTREEIAGLVAAIEHLRAGSIDGWDPDEFMLEMVELRHACDLLELAFADRAASFAATDLYEAQGSVSPVSWIRHNCRMSGNAAARSVCVGEQMEGLPRSTAAVVEGRIGFDHLALLSSTAQALRGSRTAAPFDEEPLLSQALEHSVSRFRHDCAHVRHAADAQRFLADQVDAVEARWLELSSCEDGALMVRGTLDPVGGATLRSVLEPLARRSRADDQRSRRRRYADALVELAHHGLDAGVAPHRGGQRPHLQVTTTLETLMGLAGAPAGEMEFSLPIAAATVQRLACDAGVVRVLLGADSAVIDVGRKRRVPSGSTRRALTVRDKGCVWPGCDRPPSWTAAHHVLHWAHDGVTEVPNLVLLCHRHHWMVHEGGWEIVRTGDQGMLTIPPLQGRLYRPRAPDQTAA